MILGVIVVPVIAKGIAVFAVGIRETECCFWYEFSIWHISHTNIPSGCLGISRVIPLYQEVYEKWSIAVHLSYFDNSDAFCLISYPTLNLTTSFGYNCEHNVPLYYN